MARFHQADVGVRRVADVEAGLVVSYVQVADEAGVVADEAGDAVAALSIEAELAHGRVCRVEKDDAVAAEALHTDADDGRARNGNTITSEAAPPAVLIDARRPPLASWVSFHGGAFFIERSPSRRSASVRSSSLASALAVPSPAIAKCSTVAAEVNTTSLAGASPFSEMMDALWDEGQHRTPPECGGAHDRLGLMSQTY